MRIHPFRNPGFLLPLAVAALILPSSVAQATNRTVTSLADSGTGTLRDAIAASDNGDTIDFSVTGTISLTSGGLGVGKSITITGPGANLLEVTRGSSNNFGIFGVGNDAASVTAIISGLAITNGRQNQSFGGGVYVGGATTLTLSDCRVSTNTAVIGGGISNRSTGTLTVQRCFLSDNTSSIGGAIHSNGTLVIRDSTISSNSVSANAIGGPGIGGGISAAAATISNCTIVNNTATASGGGINHDGNSELTLRDCTLAGNTAPTGGGIAAGAATISNCTFVNNTATTSGGGINHDGNSELTLRNCTFVGNTAPTGGGIQNRGSAAVALLTVSNCTISGNSATNGGGVYNTGVDGGNAFVMLDNSILQTGAAGANLVNVGDGTLITSQGYNLSNDNGGGFLIAAGDQINTNPQLGALQDNGGPTFTMALLPGSPALDQGKSFGVTTDQRGLPRPKDLATVPNASGGDGSDIGAVEMQSAPAFVVTTIADHDDSTCSPDDCTLREAINLANAAGGADTITFASGITGTIILGPGLGSLAVSDSVTITGPGARLMAVSGNSTLRVFLFSSGSNAISGLTIRDGAAMAAAGSGNGVPGGGILNSINSTLSLTNCSFSNNHVQGASNATAASAGGKGYGGGIGNSGVLTLNGCTLSGNGAAGGRGGDGSSAIGGNPHGGNGGDGVGGAIFNDTGANLTITNSTMATNSATGGAGGNGMFGGNGGNATAGVFNQGTMTMTAATLTGNSGNGGLGGTGNNMFNNGSPGVGRGGLTAGSGTSIIRNTISAGNTGNHNGGPDADGTFTSQGYNLIGIGDSSTGFNATADQVGTGAIPINAMLGSLQDNGGGTDTVGLLTSGPAVDKGKSFGLGSDQRGLSLFDNPGIPNAVGGDGRDIGAFELNAGPPLPTVLANISTRLQVETGDNVLIGGFIITGTQPKKVIVRAIGPSLPLAGVLADPLLELHGPAAFTTLTNDNWRSTQEPEIVATGIPPSNDLESAIVATLPANNSAYTAIIRGANNGTGIGLVEAYDLDRTVDSKLANISTRGLVQTGNNVLIAGTIVLGQTSQKVIIRAIGPSLSIPGKLADPTLELRDGNGGLVRSNDNWRTNQEAEIIATTIPPTNDLESAIVETLPANGAS